LRRSALLASTVRTAATRWRARRTITTWGQPSNRAASSHACFASGTARGRRLMGTRCGAVTQVAFLLTAADARTILRRSSPSAPTKRRNEQWFCVCVRVLSFFHSFILSFFYPSKFLSIHNMC